MQVKIAIGWLVQHDAGSTRVFWMSMEYYRHMSRRGMPSTAKIDRGEHTAISSFRASGMEHTCLQHGVGIASQAVDR